MSLKTKAREIHDAGVKQRAEYTPDADSIPVKLYRRWADIRPHKVPTRENFCHYARVVLIWAPLWIVLNAASRAFDRAPVAIAATIGTVVFLGVGLLSQSPVMFYLSVLGVAYVIASLSLGIIRFLYKVDRYTEDTDAEYVFVKRLSLWFPLSFVPFLLFSAIAKVGKAVGRLVKRIPAPFWTYAKRLVLCLWALAIFSFVVYGAMSNFGTFLFVVAVFSGSVVLVTGLYFAGTLIKERRRHPRIHVEWEEDSEGGIVTRTTHAPGLISKFTVGVADFFNLIFQFIRTKKWKICPIVEVPTEVDTRS